MNKNVRMLRKITILILGIVVVLAVLCAVCPFVYMVLISLTQKITLDFNFNFSTFNFDNYIRIFENLDIVQNLVNSTMVTVFACVLTCVLSSMAAFGFAKHQFPGKDMLFVMYLATMMIPGQATLIPVFTIMKKLNLLNTYAALVLPLVNAFGVFLVHQFMIGVPDELIEAARIDGCGEHRIFIKVVIPLIKPVIISLTIFTFISAWNDFLWPLVVTTKTDMQTLTLALSTLKGNFVKNYGLIMAGSTFAFLPPFVLYVFLQKYFVEGIALSGIKG